MAEEEKIVVNLGFLRADRSSGVRNDFVNEDPSLTEQQHKEACDINNIIKQYTLAGYRSEDFANLAQRIFSDASKFVDVSNVPDLQTASNMMIEARESFVQNVPAKVRAEYDNNPMKFYQACLGADAKKLREMFGDVRNYSAPTAEQLKEGNVAVPSSNDPEKK